MKSKYYFIISISLLIILNIRCHTELDSSITKDSKLEYLCRIWGFLKYYHPSISETNVNWDSVLIVTIPKIVNTPNKITFNKEIELLISSLPAVKNKTYEVPFKKVDLVPWNYQIDWMENSEILTNSITEFLDSLIINKNSFNNSYIKYVKNVGNPDLSGEIKYLQDELPSLEYRLLAIFRYWNIINYFYPYKYLMDNDWDSLLPIYISKIYHNDSKIDYHLTMLELTAELNDSHVVTTSETINEYWGNYEIPIITDYINKETVIVDFYSDSLAAIYGLEVGDIIKQLDGIPIGIIREKKKKHLSSSNSRASETRVNNYLFGGNNGDSVTITIERQGRFIDYKIKRYNLGLLIRLSKTDSKENKLVWRIFEENIGYLNMGELTIDSINEVMKKLCLSNALIIDLRYRPNGTLYELMNFLVEKKTLFAKLLVPNPKLPGLYHWDSNYYIEPNKNTDYSFSGEIVVLIDENTISQAEFTCMALQAAKDVTLIGRSTGGANGDVSTITLPGGIKTRFSGLGVYYPDISQTQRKGINPDIKIEKSIENFQNDSDDILDYAIKHLNKGEFKNNKDN